MASLTILALRRTYTDILKVFHPSINPHCVLVSHAHPRTQAPLHPGSATGSIVELEVALARLLLGRFVFLPQTFRMLNDTIAASGR